MRLRLQYIPTTQASRIAIHVPPLSLHRRKTYRPIPDTQDIKRDALSVVLLVAGGLALISILSVSLAGCSAVSKLPSFEHCHEVQYSRTGADITVSARCTAEVAF